MGNKVGPYQRKVTLSNVSTSYSLNNNSCCKWVVCLTGSPATWNIEHVCLFSMHVENSRTLVSASVQSNFRSNCFTRFVRGVANLMRVNVFSFISIHCIYLMREHIQWKRENTSEYSTLGKLPDSIFIIWRVFGVTQAHTCSGVRKKGCAFGTGYNIFTFL